MTLTDEKKLTFNMYYAAFQLLRFFCAEIRRAAIVADNRQNFP